MVNVGLRAYIWLQKSDEEKVARELWELNGFNYKTYRRYLAHVKDHGFPDRRLEGNSNGLATASSDGISQALTTPYTFSGMAHIYDVGASPVTVASFSPCSPHRLAWGTHDGCVRILSGEEPFEVLHELEDHKKAITALSWSLDGSMLLSTAADGGVCLRDASTGSLVRTYMLGSPATCCCFHQFNQNIVLVGTAAGEIHVLNCSTGIAQERVPLTGQGRSSVSAMATVGLLLFVADGAGGVHTLRCEIRDGLLRPLQRLSRMGLPCAKGCPAASLVYSGYSCLAQGPALLVSYTNSSVCVLRVDAATSQLSSVAEVKMAPAARSISAVFCPTMAFREPEHIVMGGEDTGVHIHAISTQRRSAATVNSIQGHLAPVTCVSWRADDQMLASCDCAGVVILWRREKSRMET